MLNVLTLNCQRGFQVSFKDYIEEILKNRVYDFILLQEVDPETLKNIRNIYKENKYTRLGAHSPKTESELHACILYKNEFEFLRSDFITFTPMVFQQVFEYGSIAGVFAVPRKLAKITKKKKILVISVHLHASYHLIARKKELAMIKKQALHLDPDNEYLTVIGGDFNNLMPGEWKGNDTFMKPQFHNVTTETGYTCDTAFLQPTYTQSGISKMFFVAGKNYRKKLDHIYMDKESAKRLMHKSRAIDDVVVSDHRPVELRITK